LPNLSDPIAIKGELPVPEGRLWDAMQLEGSRFRRMLKDAAELTNGIQGRAKAPAVLVDLKAPSFVIDGA
jgi:hypothetical protein